MFNKFKIQDKKNNSNYKVEVPVEIIDVPFSEIKEDKTINNSIVPKSSSYSLVPQSSNKKSLKQILSEAFNPITNFLKNTFSKTTIASPNIDHVPPHLLNSKTSKTSSHHIQKYFKPTLLAPASSSNDTIIKKSHSLEYNNHESNSFYPPVPQNVNYSIDKPLACSVIYPDQSYPLLLEKEKCLAYINPKKIKKDQEKQLNKNSRKKHLKKFNKPSIPIKFLDSQYKMMRIILTGKISNRKIKEFTRVIASLKTKPPFYSNKTWYIEKTLKVSYYIDIRKDSLFFYFIFPVQYENLMRNTVRNTWGVELEEVDDIPFIDKNALVHALDLQYNDVFSMGFNQTKNDSILSLTNIQYTMEDDERVVVYFNFQPYKDKNWKNKSETFAKKRKLGESTLKKTFNSNSAFLKLTAEVLFEMSKEALSVFSPMMLPDKMAEKKKDHVFKPSHRTLEKRKGSLLKTQCFIFSSSKNVIRQGEFALSVANSFQHTDGDNEIFSKHIYLDKLDLFENIKSKYPYFIIYPNEAHNFLQLPTSHELKQNDNVEFSKVEEIKLPKDLQQGFLKIGMALYMNQWYQMYFTTNMHFSCLPIVLVAPPRCGKTSFIQNMILDNYNNQRANIFFDFCGACEASKELHSLIPEKDRIIIDCSSYSHIESFCFSEAIYEKEIVGEDAVFKKYEQVKKLASQACVLLNAFSEEESKKLTPKMRRYLISASILTFLLNGTFYDILQMIRNVEVRKEKIEEVKNKYIYNNQNMSDGKTKDSILYEKLLSEHFYCLNELTRLNKNDEEENLTTNIQGIIDRFQNLQENAYLEQMLFADPLQNYNLIDLVQQKKTIFIQMPSNLYEKQSRDAICTFWINRILYALRIRKNMYENDIEFYENAVMVNLYIDELYQVPACMRTIKEEINQVAKTKLKLILSCHHINQFGTAFREELKNANSDYIFLKGTRPESLEDFKEDLSPLSYTDLMNAPDFFSLNYVKSKDGYVKFLSKMPEPIEGRAK